MFHLTVSRITRLLPLAIVLATGPASAQMVPLEDLRQDDVQVFYQATSEDYQINHPGAPFASWADQTTALAEVYEPCENPPPDQCLVGSCTGLAFQYSEFFSAGLQFSGGTSASWGLPPSGGWSLSSISGFKFRIDNTLDYDLFIQVDQGQSRSIDGNAGGAVYLKAYHSGGSTDLHYVLDGQLQVTGRLGPGTYEVFGWSQKVGGLDSFTGMIYSAQFTVSQPQAPHIAVQPSDHSTACGGTSVFSVGTSFPQSNYTFQWRRNFVPLTNGPGIVGATTSTLTLTNACSDADYDVVVTGPNPAGGGPIAEPSRLAHLNIISTPTSVDTEPTSPTVPVLRAPAPNPFRVSTSVAYDVQEPTRLIANVYNASGARIRSIADRMVSTPGSVTWDGRIRSGARAPVGVYFVRIELGSVRRTGKVALLQ